MSRQEEFERRTKIWDDLVDKGGPTEVRPALVSELRIHRGQMGVYRDLEHTASVGREDSGVAMGLLFTGDHYADAVFEDGVVYHYPVTERGHRDSREILSLKSAGELALPVFVVLKSNTSKALRDVRLGWIVDFDDSSSQLLIEFGTPDHPRPQLQSGHQPALEFDESRSRSQRSVLARPRQAHFRFSVFKRYGCCCAVCDVTTGELLQAAHVVSVVDGGPDDPRNGLVLCMNHHRALDTGLLKIDPDDLSLVAGEGADLTGLGVRRQSLCHLSDYPDKMALERLWGSS